MIDSDWIVLPISDPKLNKQEGRCNKYIKTVADKLVNNIINNAVINVVVNKLINKHTTPVYKFNKQILAKQGKKIYTFAINLH